MGEDEEEQDKEGFVEKPAVDMRWWNPRWSSRRTRWWRRTIASPASRARLERQGASPGGCAGARAEVGKLERGRSGTGGTTGEASRTA